MNLILGSKSPARAHILSQAGYTFTIMTAEIDEKAIRHDDYRLLPLLVARAKTETLIPLIKDPAIIVTADIVVVHDGELREKPHSFEEARRFLYSYSASCTNTHCALVVTNTQTGKRAEVVDSAKICFRDIPQKTLDRLLQKPYLLLCAGALMVEDPLISAYVEKIEGTIESIMGMPLAEFERLRAEVLNP